MTVVQRISFRRFKQFNDHTVDVNDDPLTLVAGTNNSGKSSLLQGFAVWEFCRTVLMAEKGPEVFLEGGGRTQGLGMGDDEFSPINLPSLKHLWTNLRAQKVAGVDDDGYTLTIRVDWTGANGDRHLEFALALSNDRLFLRVNDSDLQEGDPIPRVAYLPPFAGITDREERLPGAIRRRRIGEGLAGAILRNLLLDMQEENSRRRRELRGARTKLTERDLRDLRATDPWELLQQALRTTFGAQLIVLPFNDAYHSYIRVEIEKGVSEGHQFRRHAGYNKRDLMVEGSGFLQWLGVYTLATSGDVDLLLLDEPDAHLHSSLQEQQMLQLETLAKATKKQVLVATHSSELLSNTDAAKILRIRGTSSAYLRSESDKVGLLSGLGSDFSPRLQAIHKTKRILFVEGSSDEGILKAFAETLGREWPSGWTVWRMSRGHKERKQLVEALQSEIPGLKAISLVDRDHMARANVDRDLRDKSVQHSDSTLCLAWRRRHIECYLLDPGAIARCLGQNESDVRDSFAEFGLAVPPSFRDSDAPQALMDADAKSILRTDESAILGSPGRRIFELAKEISAADLCEDIRTFFQQLDSWA